MDAAASFACTDLIETLRFEPDEGLAALDECLARLGERAAAQGIVPDRHAILNELQAATFRLRSAAAVRLRIAASGALAIEAVPIAR